MASISRKFVSIKAHYIGHFKKVQKLNSIHVFKVLILPGDDRKRIRMMRAIGDAGPLRYINKEGEFQFYI